MTTLPTLPTSTPSPSPRAWLDTSKGSLCTIWATMPVPRRPSKRFPTAAIKEIASLAKLALASIYHDTNRDPQAIEIYKQLADHPTTSVSKSTAQFLLASLYEENHQADEARKLYQQMAKESPLPLQLPNLPASGCRRLSNRGISPSVLRLRRLPSQRVNWPCHDLVRSPTLRSGARAQETPVDSRRHRRCHRDRHSAGGCSASGRKSTRSTSSSTRSSSRTTRKPTASGCTIRTGSSIPKSTRAMRTTTSSRIGDRVANGASSRAITLTAQRCRRATAARRLRPPVG